MNKTDKSQKNNSTLSFKGLTAEQWSELIKKRVEENLKLSEDELQTKYNMPDNIWD